MFLRIGFNAALLCSALLTASCAPQQDAKTPLEITRAMSLDRLSKMTGTFAARVEDGEASGYVIMVARDGNVVFEETIGLRDIKRELPMTIDTKFRIASMTKPVTAVAILTLLEEGKISLDDPVKDFLPEIGAMRVQNPDGDSTQPGRDMSIRDLSTHTSGIGYRFDADSPLGQSYIEAAPYENASSLTEAVQLISQQDLYFDPGERFFYSYSTDVLGRIVEVVSGEPFEAYTKRVIFNPLGMSDTSFTISEDDRNRIGSVYTKPPNEDLVEMPGDLFGDPFNPQTWPSGGAGLISTAPDYIRFAMMLEQGGSYEGVQILSPASVKLMASDHLPDNLQQQLLMTPLAGVGIGLSVAVVKDPARIGRLGAVGDFAWGGHYDTQFFVSPEYGIAAVIMTQLQPHPDADDTDTMTLFKTQVLAAMIDE